MRRWPRPSSRSRARRGRRVHAALPAGDEASRAYGACDARRPARRAARGAGHRHPALHPNFESRFDEAVVPTSCASTCPGARPSRAPTATATSSSRRCWTVRPAWARRRSPRATTPASTATRTPARPRRGLDRGKDQSYFLFALTQAQMARALFPVGGLDKPTVRAHARRLGLRVADKPDSLEICSRSTATTPPSSSARPRLTRAGAIVGTDGRVVGTHEGVHRFTIGQRKGLRRPHPSRSRWASTLTRPA
ncbi:MAG: tRNA methyl transferase PRC-barrel domain-containing protein [Vicinamibacterales bacterium]